MTSAHIDERADTTQLKADRSKQYARLQQICNRVRSIHDYRHMTHVIISHAYFAESIGVCDVYRNSLLGSFVVVIFEACVRV